MSKPDEALAGRRFGSLVVLCARPMQRGRLGVPALRYSVWCDCGAYLELLARQVRDRSRGLHSRCWVGR